MERGESRPMLPKCAMINYTYAKSDPAKALSDLSTFRF